MTTTRTLYTRPDGLHVYIVEEYTAATLRRDPRAAGRPDDKLTVAAATPAAAIRACLGDDPNPESEFDSRGHLWMADALHVDEVDQAERAYYDDPEQLEERIRAAILQEQAAD